MIYGLVAEFNPFHNGHKHIIDSIKTDDNTFVVAVMSGNFVQRGEPAIISKFARAKAAIQCGVDLVLELPVPYSISTAMHFAGGAVNILESLGVVNAIAFGSECGDFSKLRKIADVISDERLHSVLKSELKKGKTFAAARTEAAKLIDPDLDISVLTNPNDTLGIEYISAADRLNFNPEFKVIKRIGAEHDSLNATENFCSASFLRKNPTLLTANQNYMPNKAFDIYSEEILNEHFADISLIERGIIAHLRTVDAEELANAPDVSEGLENKISIAANNYSSLEEILAASKSKRYTHARLRRILLASYLGITADLQKEKIPYIRILAMNNNGEKILSMAKSKAKVPIVSSIRDAENIGIKAAKFAKLEIKAGDIYSLCLKKPLSGKLEYTTRLIKNF